MGIIILKTKGFTLINSLFSLSIYIVCIITFISLYTLGRKQLIKIENDYQNYITSQIEKEKNICIEEDLENMIKDLQ